MYVSNLVVCISTAIDNFNSLLLVINIGLGFDYL